MDRAGYGQVLKRDIARIAQVGAVTGSVAGFAGLMAAKGSSALAGATAAGWTWLLVATLPLGLAGLATLAARRGGPSAYAAPNVLGRVRVLLVVGLLGGVGGVVLEFVVASYVPTLFSLWRLDAATVRASLVAAYPWTAACCALGATAAMALSAGLAFHLSQARRR
jgi:hypothetical protein